MGHQRLDNAFKVGHPGLSHQPLMSVVELEIWAELNLVLKIKLALEMIWNMTLAIWTRNLLVRKVIILTPIIIDVPVWSSWAVFEYCNKACGGGFNQKVRICSEPNQCLGNSTQMEECNTHPCPGYLI